MKGKFRAVTKGALALGFLLASSQVQAEPPGWYFEVDGLWTRPSTSDGSTFQPGIPATPGTPATNGCLLGDLLGLGSVLDGLGAVNGSGCLLALLGPDVPGTDPTAGSPATNFGTRIKYKDGFGGGVSFGYAFDGGFRPELNLGYSKTDWDTITITLADGSSATNSASSSDLTTYRVMANAWYDIDFGSFVIPYLGGGVGYQRTEISSDGSDADDGGMAYQLGAGIGFLVGDRTTLSLDYRYVTADDPEYSSGDGGKLKTEYASHNAGLGVRYAFGDGIGQDSDGDGVPDRTDKCPNTPAGVTVYTDGCPTDLDQDGVPDYLDKCPNTPAGAPVNSEGCPTDSDGDGVPDHADRCPGTPAGVRVDDKGCPYDADGDGVPDYLDQCPGTPAGTPVNAVGCTLRDSDGDGVPDNVDKCPSTPRGQIVGPDGCPLDSDGDGIPDEQDDCPNTPPGLKVLPNGCAPKGDCRRPRPGEAVDAKGCAVDQRFVLRGVKFEFDSDRLTQPAQIVLNDVAETLAAYPELKVDVEGHTDSLGTDAYNLGLSERRANAVKRYLGGHGISGDRLRPVGYGESAPIDSNDTETGRENNRRVEFKVNGD